MREEICDEDWGKMVTSKICELFSNRRLTPDLLPEIAQMMSNLYPSSAPFECKLEYDPANSKHKKYLGISGKHVLSISSLKDQKILTFSGLRNAT
jgi:hypothetical protein